MKEKLIIMIIKKEFNLFCEVFPNENISIRQNFIQYLNRFHNLRFNLTIGNWDVFKFGCLEILRSGFYGLVGLNSVKIPNGVWTIRSSAFNCSPNLKSIDMSEIKNEVSIESFVFANCANLSDVKLPNSLTCIGRGCFSFCINLKEIHIPESVTFIGDSAFSNCINLEKINIPKNVERISRDTFENCTNLTVYLEKGSHLENSIVFLKAVHNCKGVKIYE